MGDRCQASWLRSQCHAGLFAGSAEHSKTGWAGLLGGYLFLPDCGGMEPMATKRKRRVKSKSRIDLFAQAKRQFAKGNYRDALKGAKACYRQEPTSEGRHLLEHTLMAS